MMSGYRCRVGWYTETEDDDDVSDLDEFDDDAAPRSWLKWIAIGLAAWIAVTLMILGGMLKYQGGTGTTLSSGLAASGADTSNSPSAITDLPPGSSTAPAESSTDSSGAPTLPSGGGGLPVGWTIKASDTQSDCSAHSFGQVRTYFAQMPCVELHRWLATTSWNGRDVIVSWATVRMPDTGSADQFLALVSRDGTGNISDLLRDGPRIEGLPDRLPIAAFTSMRSDTVVHVAEAAWAEGMPSSNDSGLQALANQASILN
jgi:hypothetical protein